MSNKKEVPCFYLWLQGTLYKKSNRKGELNKKEAIAKLRQPPYLFPKSLCIILVKELELLGLAKSMGRFKIKVIRPEIDIEKDHNKLFQRVGLF